MTFISRRDLLKRAGAIGAAAAVPGDVVRGPEVGRPFEGRDDDGGPERPALHAVL